MAVVIDIHDAEETKWEKFKRKAKEKFEVAKGWCIYHQEDLLVYIPIGLAGVAGICKYVGRARRLNQEQKLKDLYIYDRSMGRYVELRRKLRQKDLVEISRRRKNGERLTDILVAMKLVR